MTTNDTFESMEALAATRGWLITRGRYNNADAATLGRVVVETDRTTGLVSYPDIDPTPRDDGYTLHMDNGDTMEVPTFGALVDELNHLVLGLPYGGTS